MNYLITGGTGFVGKHLTVALTAQGHHVYILTRAPERHTNTTRTSFISYEQPVEELPLIHGVINLAGDSLFGYWSKKKKAAIRNSRIETTQQLIEMMKQMQELPAVFISGSAVGFYGTSEDSIFTEQTTKAGGDFLAGVVAEWEQTAKQAEDLGVRTVCTRFGVILGDEGALPLMKLPVKLFAGGKIGSGQQWMSWVHIEDVVGIIQFCLSNKQMSGPVNVTAPNPKRNKDFISILARVLRRPDWIPTPALAVRTVIGEMSILVTHGQYVLPKKAEDHGYPFAFPQLEAALRKIEQSKIG
ncbi:TIGR01777 family oxidoreductase [Lentibacillus cibarius]|uniref:TIGR01777 family protein n=1 Tax=Lentibacillus cibarius TaxID=2583219 RepID=A0A5S3QMG2_9BACI|nr:TIGR01777 family oxidoreductase [Lentibacillus cibarius]TMN22848.1 TIGR01777 family protein [Lentibacillus cibarius]